MFLLRLGLVKPFFNIGTLIDLQISHTIRRFADAHRVNLNMETLYIRRPVGSEELHINFHYENPDLGINRDFNFCRNASEKVDDALTRIKNNVEKELNKRAKKSKKKSAAQVHKPIPNVVNNEISIEFLRGADEIRITNVTFAEMLESLNDNLQMRLLDRTFQIVYNRPWVVNLALPASVMAGFMVYPSKLEMQFANPKCCNTLWMKAKKPASGDMVKDAKWEECGNGLIYHTVNDDIGYYLKFIIIPTNEEGEVGPQAQSIMKQDVQAGAGPYPFQIRHSFTKKRLTGKALRIVSYNILADLYADSDFSRTNLFPYCPPYALAIDYRKQLLLKELIGYNADIICLQEVDLKIFDVDLKIVLESSQFNYSGNFAQKGQSGEGVATFYRADRFELISTHDLNIGENIPNLPEFQCIWEKISANEKLVQRVCERATTLTVVRLRHKESGKILLVCNTHLYFHPDADHIRLLQMGLCMLYVESLFTSTLSEFKVSDENKVSIIFCGDFNSVPECGIYKLMTERFVGDDFIDWSSNTEETIKNVSLSQPFAMQSACGTPKYTNYTPAFAACLDYIFYQKDRFSVAQVVPLPTDEELQVHIAIPSVVFPSDHIALVSDLVMK